MTRALFLEAPATSRGPLPWLLALGAGLGQAASLAWPGPGSLAGQPLWWLQILSLALLGRVLLGAGSARRASSAMTRSARRSVTACVPHCTLASSLA